MLLDIGNYVHIHSSMTISAELRAAKDCHCLAARRRARALSRLYEERLRPHGLRATQFSVLAALALKGPTCVGELAEFLVLERTTLTRGATLLEKKGWVDAAPSADARERRLRLTAAGRRKLEAALPSWQEAQALAGRAPSRPAHV